jgi:hypothetical protein
MCGICQISQRAIKETSGIRKVRGQSKAGGRPEGDLRVSASSTYSYNTAEHVCSDLRSMNVSFGAANIIN